MIISKNVYFPNPEDSNQVHGETVSSSQVFLCKDETFLLVKLNKDSGPEYLFLTKKEATNLIEKLRQFLT